MSGAGSRCAALAGAGVLRAAAGVAALVAVIPAAAGNEASEGERLYGRVCLVCHAVEPGYHKEGPSLAGVFGRRAGAAPLYGRYRGLKDSSIVWDERALDAWLANPRAFLGGRDTTMTLAVPTAAERSAIIAYLRTLR